MKTEKYPIDIDAYKKGELILQAVCEEIVGQKANDGAYKLALLSLREKIEEMYEEANDPRVLKVEGNGLRILLDRDAINYLEDQAKRGCRMIRKSARRLIGKIDRSQLNTAERVKHDAAINVNAFRVFALRKAAKDAKTKTIEHKALKQLE